eukprot:scaffold262253_cov19-Prasinocladus_malaysianus.AAC.1
MHSSEMWKRHTRMFRIECIRDTIGSHVAYGIMPHTNSLNGFWKKVFIWLHLGEGGFAGGPQARQTSGGRRPSPAAQGCHARPASAASAPAEGRPAGPAAPQGPAGAPAQGQDEELLLGQDP